MKIISFLLIVLLGLTACQPNPEHSETLQRLDLPVLSKSGGEANLFVSPTNRTYLSWVEYFNDSVDVLQFSELKNEKWTNPIEIARGSDWFVNWADFPSLVASADGQYLAAHWLAKSATGSYEYDIHVSQSTDGGQHWSPSFIPHRDSIAAEHGFVTMLPVGKEQFFATWLDGRNTKTGTEETHGHDDPGHGGGAMTLRAAIFDKNAQLTQEVELDERICDCCQTDAAMTDKGLVVVYRDRSAAEIRDIGIVRQLDGKWTAPTLIHTDNWTIAGCPVNGPAIAAHGNQLVVAWFTMKGEQAIVNVAFSSDAGAIFSTPIRIDDGQPLGRVDVVWLDQETVSVTWLEKAENQDKAMIRLAKVDALGHILLKQDVVETVAARKSGFPILEKVGKDLILAWTAVDGEQEFVKTALLR